ncbi:M16 family metallopeptidase [Roseateles cellulosilyticus]|uniref:Insulinase family protein n=1 Tax=Pelomonas cellulosilytica TaxID=2906762 RepID=A0ABS8Y2S1_9BURK|nr:pitrilysin family protein [Pelomonas sp. P8]MCE4557416.1 insulinase family protein [Pelomonas sp. P8]
MNSPAPRRLVALLALAGALSLPAWSAPVAPQPGAVSTEAGQLAIRHEKFKLANGFEVILVEDHRLPLVAFNLWVHAGPRNEAQGQTGFAHLFEHLMFAGSRHIPRGEFDKYIDAAGGTDANGSTNFDRTNYFFTLPSNQLALGLWLKADMLGWMIDEVDSVSLANQQDVVRNERRQSYENRPYGVADEAMYQALYPAGHPYRASVIGSHADIQSIQLKDVKDFARTYYRPNNATLVLAGDFDPKAAKALLQKYFGTLKAGPKPPEVHVAMPEITKERRVVVTDRVELSRLTLAWHTPPMFKAGDAELDVAAHVLGGGKASRLYGLLVRDKQLAQSVEVGQGSQSLSSVFEIEVVARPGASLDEIEALVDAEVARLAAEPPTEAEVAQARATIETQLLQRMEKVASLADLVNHYNQMADDPGFVGQDLARYAKLKPADVSATVAQWLQKDRRVAVIAKPGEQVLPPEVPTPPAPTQVGKGEREALNAAEPWRAKPPAAAKAKALALPAAQSFTLANGLTVIHSPKPGLPLVSASLVLRAGQAANPARHPGLAGFVAAMLPEGTTTRSAQQIAEGLAALGATLNAQAGSEEVRIDFSGRKAAAREGLALLADVALHPAFGTTEIERQKAQRLAALAQQREQAPVLASAIGNRVVFGDGHPLAENALGTGASIQAIDVAALRSFWQAHYRPEQAALVVAGDLTEAELRALVEPLFGAWKVEGTAPPETRLPPPRPIGARTVVVDKPGAPQTALAVVAPGPLASTPDVAPLKVMNAALGGLFTSRINNQLREVKGYTYGIYSGYTLGRERGQFGIRGSVRTDVTGAALADMWKEIEGIRATPMGAAELNRVRNAQLLSLPGLFDTNLAVVAGYAGNWSSGLPLSAITDLPKQYGAVTPATALKAAQQHLDPAQLIVVAVGDKAKVLPQLDAIGRKAEVRDADGRPVAPSAGQ